MVLAEARDLRDLPDLSTISRHLAPPRRVRRRDLARSPSGAHRGVQGCRRPATRRPRAATRRTTATTAATCSRRRLTSLKEQTPRPAECLTLPVAEARRRSHARRKLLARAEGRRSPRLTLLHSSCTPLITKYYTPSPPAGAWSLRRARRRAGAAPRQPAPEYAVSVIGSGAPPPSPAPPTIPTPHAARRVHAPCAAARLRCGLAGARVARHPDRGGPRRSPGTPRSAPHVGRRSLAAWLGGWGAWTGTEAVSDKRAWVAGRGHEGNPVC